MMRIGRLHISSDTVKQIFFYAAIMGILNLVWEVAHLPLYTLWEDPDFVKKVTYILHCTLGDILIAVATLIAALVFKGNAGWPDAGWRETALITIALGLLYTIFSEWLNVSIRQSWAYRDIMPLVPPFGTGLSPLLQWLFLPAIASWSVHKIARTTRVRKAGLS